MQKNEDDFCFLLKNYQTKTQKKRKQKRGEEQRKTSPKHIEYLLVSMLLFKFDWFIIKLNYYTIKQKETEEKQNLQFEQHKKNI